MNDSGGFFIAFLFVLGLVVGVLCGMSIQEDFEIGRNHNTQELCEYEHQTKCVNAWIKEDMQNHKSLNLSLEQLTKGETK